MIHLSPTTLRAAPLFLFLLMMVVLIPLRGLESQPPADAALTLRFSQATGYYEEALLLELSGAGTIWFTQDGRIPTPANATRYTTPIFLNATQPHLIIIRARLQTVDNQLGPVISHSYFLNIPATLPLLSLIIEPDDMWGAENGIYTNYEQRGRLWERSVDVAYVAADRQSGFHLLAGLRIHGRGSRLLDKKSLRLYFRQEYGASRLIYPLFEGNNEQSFKRLVIHNGGQDEANFHVNWTHMRNQIASGLAQKIGSQATRSQPALLFINGEFWGIYQIRERIDEHFLADQYGIEKADMLDTPEELIRTDHVVLGNREHWDAMMDFVVKNDLTDPQNYAYLATQMDIENYIDYNLLQIYIANDDWPHHNMRVFRPQAVGGRWQWMFWDTDRSLAFGPEASPPEKNMLAHVRTPVETATGRQVILLEKLLANELFRNAFLVRLALLLNDELTTEAVLREINTLAELLAPDIHWEVGRWPTDVDAWQAHVAQLRDFARRRPALLRQHVLAEFGIPQMVQLRLNPTEQGMLILEDKVMDRDWLGNFFAGSIVQITAVPAPGYQFSGWQEIEGPASLSLALVAEQTLTPRFEPVPEGVPRVGDVIITAVTPTYIEFETTRPLDLRGWRLTDNDSIITTVEGSLIFDSNSALAHVGSDTPVRIYLFCEGDDEIMIDGTIVLAESKHNCLRNGGLNGWTDPGFYMGKQDSIVLLAPGITADFADDQPITAYTTAPKVTQLVHQFQLPPQTIKVP